MEALQISDKIVEILKWNPQGYYAIVGTDEDCELYVPGGVIKKAGLLPKGPGSGNTNEIRHLINEVDAQDRSLEHCGEGMAIDETLEEICELLRREGKRVKKTRVLVAA